MSMLERIFAEKREEVAAAKARISIEELKEVVLDMNPVRGFKQDLERTHRPIALIAEIKKASPSRGLIRADFDPLAIANDYMDANVQAVSVLTDQPHFMGNLRYLEMVRCATVFACLRKDFICDPYQVYESRTWGADAILLILAGLEKSLAADLRAMAIETGMDVLVEVHTEAEAEVALELKADLIGVNNRNLTDFKTSLDVSRKIIPMLLQGDGPHPLVVSESAIETFEDVEAVRLAGARAVLIGTAFCASNDIPAKVKEVMGW